MDQQRFNYVVVLEVQHWNIFVNDNFNYTRQDWIEYVGPDFEEARQVYDELQQSAEQRTMSRTWVYNRKFIVKVPWGRTEEGLLNEEVVTWYKW